MMWFRRVCPVISVVMTICVLSGLHRANAQVPTPKPATKNSGCPVTPYSHPNDPDDAYVGIPPPAPGETIDNVLIPGGKPVGCENPKYRLIRGSEKDAHDLFARLTKGARRGKFQPRAPISRVYTVWNFLSEVAIRPDGIAVGFSKPAQCRGPIIWVFQWPGEVQHKYKPTMLEFVDDSIFGRCMPLYGDADGGGP